MKCNDTPMKKGVGIRSVAKDDNLMSGELQSLYRSCVGTLLYITKNSRTDL